MTRTRVSLDPALLKAILRLTGERTHTKAVERALTDFVRGARARRILELAGSGRWEGNLSEMRGDNR